MADTDPIQLVGTEWTVSTKEKRSTGDYENVEPFASVSGDIAQPAGELDEEARRCLQAKLLALHKDLQAVVERAADNRVAHPDSENWGVPEDYDG